MKNFWKSETGRIYGPGILLTAAAILVFAIYGCLHLYWTQQLEEKAQEQLVQENTPVVSDQESPDELVLSGVDNTQRINLTGVDAARKQSDDDMMADLISYAVTWSNSSEYANSRNHLMKKYSWLSEDSAFLSSFFPPVDRMVIKDSAGNVVSNPLDDGRNIAFASFYSYVVDVQEETYYYVAEVSTQSSGVAGGGTATGKILLTYWVDGSGEAGDIQAYVISN